MKTKLIIAFILIVVILLGLSLFLGKDQNGPSQERRDISFSVFVPGKSTKDEVLKKAGAPALVETHGTKTSFYYGTGNPSLRDVVVFQNNILLYAVENVFSDDELSLESVLSSYGEYKTYDSEGTPFLFYAFLERGIAIEAGKNSITRILYFIPQEEETFLESIGNELGISKEEPTPELLRP